MPAPSKFAGGSYSAYAYSRNLNDTLHSSIKPSKPLQTKSTNQPPAKSTDQSAFKSASQSPAKATDQSRLKSPSQPPAKSTSQPPAKSRDQSKANDPFPPLQKPSKPNSKPHERRGYKYIIAKAQEIRARDAQNGNVYTKFDTLMSTVLDRMFTYYRYDKFKGLTHPFLRAILDDVTRDRDGMDALIVVCVDVFTPRSRKYLGRLTKHNLNQTFEKIGQENQEHQAVIYVWLFDDSNLEHDMSEHEEPMEAEDEMEDETQDEEGYEAVEISDDEEAFFTSHTTEDSLDRDEEYGRLMSGMRSAIATSTMPEPTGRDVTKGLYVGQSKQWQKRKFDGEQQLAGL